jgi:hypothetical protein
LIVKYCTIRRQGNDWLILFFENEVMVAQGLLGSIAAVKKMLKSRGYFGGVKWSKISEEFCQQLYSWE